jgi:hypothetical protein
MGSASHDHEALSMRVVCEGATTIEKSARKFLEAAWSDTASKMALARVRSERRMRTTARAISNETVNFSGLHCLCSVFEGDAR